MQRSEGKRSDAHEELDLANQFHTPEYWLDTGPYDEDEIRLLAAGLVPPRMRAQALALLSFDDLLENNAARPAKKGKR